MAAKEETESIQIVAGRNHGASLRRDGRLYVWGVGLSGQLGVKKEDICRQDAINNKIVHPLQERVPYYEQVNF